MNDGGVIRVLWNLIISMLEYINTAWAWLSDPDWYIGIKIDGIGINWVLYEGAPLGLLAGASLLVLVGWWIFRG